AAPLAQKREGFARGHRLDPPGTRANGSLREDHERSDLGCRTDVRATAELPRVAVDLDDPDLVAVLLAEEHHGAELARFLDRRHERADRTVLEDDLVHGVLDLLSLPGRERLGMGEVEAKFVGPHRR